MSKLDKCQFHPLHKGLNHSKIILSIAFRQILKLIFSLNLAKTRLVLLLLDMQYVSHYFKFEV